MRHITRSSLTQTQGMFDMKRPFFAATLTLLATPMWAENLGDASAGETLFARKCVACHTIMAPNGTKIAGRGAQAGPNLYGVAGRVMGAQEGFRYSRSMQAAHDAGLIWDETSLSAFIQDPTAYLRSALDDPRARSKMSLRIRKEQEALDIYAYLHSVAPPPVE